jgi:hypothetical protein
MAHDRSQEVLNLAHLCFHLCFHLTCSRFHLAHPPLHLYAVAILLCHIVLMLFDEERDTVGLRVNVICFRSLLTGLPFPVRLLIVTMATLVVALPLRDPLATLVLALATFRAGSPPAQHDHVAAGRASTS